MLGTREETDVVLEHFGTAWAVVRRDVTAWVAPVAVFAVLVLTTCGLALVLAPNLLRATARALEEGRPPSVRDVMMLRHLLENVMLLALAVGAALLGQAVPVLGAVLVATLLVWAPMLVVDGHYGVVEAVIVSVRGSLRGIRDTLPFQLVAMLAVGLATMCCVVPVLVALPVVLAASWIFYEVERPELLALGDRMGLRRR